MIGSPGSPILLPAPGQHRIERASIPDDTEIHHLGAGGEDQEGEKRNEDSCELTRFHTESVGRTRLVPHDLVTDANPVARVTITVGPTSDSTRARRGVRGFRRDSDGERIAQQSTVAWFPLLARLVAMVVVAYQLSSRGRITGRGIVAFGLAAAGVMAFLDGFTLVAIEENRVRYGRVSSGVVIEKFSSSGAQGTRRMAAGAAATRRTRARSSLQRALPSTSRLRA